MSRSRKHCKGDDLLEHVDAIGQARMVDVSGKRPTSRWATAEASVDVGRDTAERILRGGLAKGDVLAAARFAGILAAKRTPELIPLCHPLALDAVKVSAEVVDDRVCLRAEVRCRGRTGVEMEAMTAAAVAALTIYDMVKSAGKGVQIGPIRLLEKHGGKSGRWQREEPGP